MATEDAILRQDVLRRLYIACFLCFCFIIVEVTGGLMSHSLAVLSDAAHLVSDFTSFAVASEYNIRYRCSCMVHI